MTNRIVEQELLEVETQYWQAIKDKDAAAAMRLTDTPCIVTGAQGLGQIDKQALSQVMNAAPYTLDEFQVDDVQVRLLRDDVAIVAYKVQEKLTVDGKPVSLEAADSSTWRTPARRSCAAACAE